MLHAGALKNCLFNTDDHFYLVTEKDVLVEICMPLVVNTGASNTPFTEKEMEGWLDLIYYYYQHCYKSLSLHIILCHIFSSAFYITVQEWIQSYGWQRTIQIKNLKIVMTAFKCYWNVS